MIGIHIRATEFPKLLLPIQKRWCKADCYPKETSSIAGHLSYIIISTAMNTSNINGYGQNVHKSFLGELRTSQAIQKIHAMIMVPT